MRKTLFRQLLFYMMLFIIILTVISYVVIDLYFNDYYYRRQEKVLIQHTKELVEAYNINNFEALKEKMNVYADEYGIKIQLFGSDYKVMYDTSSQGMSKRVLSSILLSENIDKIFVTYTGGGQGTARKSSWLSYLMKTDDGKLLLARMSYESMDESIVMAKGFFLIFGIIIIFAFIIFAFFFSRSMSTPLRKLNAIATDMGQLNFSLRYQGNRQDEIGHLGNTLNRLTTKLENTILQLTGELSKEKTLEKMRTQFTAQVSHELQTPLSVIKGYTEALSDNLYKSGEIQNVYDIILNETEKISNMVDDLLDLSQMEAGAYILSNKNFNLSELIKKIYEHYNVLSYEKMYSINMHIDYPTNITYYGDPLRLEQAIRNVLVNAIKHVRDNGDININLSMLHDSSLISISNQGENITKEDLPNIFDSYYQGEKSVEGYGLGLAITRHIINLHGGEISADNVEDGVVFVIQLP
jgi:two-component system, OmpR family, sensor histidine kinase VanS